MKSGQNRGNTCLRSFYSAAHTPHTAGITASLPPAICVVGLQGNNRKVQVAMKDKNLTILQLHASSNQASPNGGNINRTGHNQSSMQFWRVKAAVNAGNVIAPKIRHQVKTKTGRDLLDIAALNQNNVVFNSKKNLMDIVQKLQHTADRSLSMLSNNLNTMLSSPPIILDGSDAYISGGYIAEPFFNPKAPRNDGSSSSPKRSFVYGKRKYKTKDQAVSSSEPAAVQEDCSSSAMQPVYEEEISMLDADRHQADRHEAERHERERQEMDRQEVDRQEIFRQEMERQEMERYEADQQYEMAARIQAARMEAQLEMERMEMERMEAEQVEAERREAEEAALRCMCPRENESTERWQQRLAETHDGAQLCWDHKGIADDDFEKYWQENASYFALAPKWNHQEVNSAEPDWRVCSEGKNYKVWRKPLPGTSVYTYKVQASFDDVVPRDMFRVQTDIKLRHDWDEYITELKIIASDQKTNSELVHWITNCPRPMQPREYVYKRRTQVDTNNHTMLVFNEATQDASNVPDVPNIFRVNTYESKLLLRSNKENLDEDGVDFILTYHDNPETNAPTFIVNKLAIHGIGVVMERIQAVSHRLKQERLTTGDSPQEASNGMQH